MAKKEKGMVRNIGKSGRQG